jgi:diacylglycerol kinase (ATP)
MIGLEATRSRSDGIVNLPPERQASPDRRRRLQDAYRGLKFGVRGHASFFVYFFFAALVFAAGIVLRCSPVEWCSLLAGVALMLIAELFNSALETICHGLDEPSQARLRPALDIGSAAVLLASAVAVVIAAIIFFSRIILLFA